MNVYWPMYDDASFLVMFYTFMFGYVIVYWFWYLKLFDERGKWYESVALAFMTLFWPLALALIMMGDSLSLRD